ncbi:hypothetical protein [Bradyrhizobium sp.]|uniref:hypothetical protein n=1 Tax=Bradyrhizobium sp. TaxID=376 RepID=UPI0039E2C93B
MTRPIATLLCCAVALCLALLAAAEDAAAPMRAPPPPAKNTMLTGKERLGPKWTDEQRIDNCRVPVDKRGTRPRPTLCQDDLTN